jgi:Fic family protein
MDSKDFTEYAPGRIVPISTDWGSDHAFIPNQLPPNWEFPLSLWPRLAEAKEQIGVLEGLGRYLPNPGLLLQPLKIREALQSSALEGTFSTARQLLLFELASKSPDASPATTADLREVQNCRQALQHAFDSDLPLSWRLIKELHAILMAGVRGQNQTPGEFRHGQVGIGSRGRFIPPPASEVPQQMDALEKYLHDADHFDPLVRCFLVHYQFESIHPFWDGNGRVGRFILALMLQRGCTLSKPWLFLSDALNRRRSEYIERLYRVSTHGDWGGWIEFCLHATIAQAQSTAKRCDDLMALKERYRHAVTVAGGSIRLSGLVERLFESPYISITEAAAVFGVHYQTAQKDLDRLAEVGVLREIQGLRPKTYFAPELYDIAYGDLES